MKVKSWQIITVIICIILGILLHFTYEWSGENMLVGLFSAVNESTWEHIKIALTATFVWSLVDGFLYGKLNNYFFSKTISILILIVLIPLIFYGFKWLFGKSYFFIDILIFYIVIVISQMIFIKSLSLPEVSYLVNYLSIVFLFIIFGFYMILTLMPLKNFFFKDPITKKYGIDGHYRYFRKKRS